VSARLNVITGTGRWPRVTEECMEDAMGDSNRARDGCVDWSVLQSWPEAELCSCNLEEDILQPLRHGVPLQISKLLVHESCDLRYAYGS